jgi:hypothetical protein
VSLFSRSFSSRAVRPFVLSAFGAAWIASIVACADSGPSAGDGDGEGDGSGGRGESSGGGSGDPMSGGSTATGGDGAGGGVGTGGDDGVMDPGTEGDGQYEIGPDYTTDPDLTDLGNPKGQEFSFTMNSEDSEIFNGDDSTLLPEHQHPFTRQVWVYVPAQYQDGDDAPILVIHDGPGQLGLVKNALDNLTISEDPARKLPAFIAIAVQNGGSDSKGSERGLEYDTMSDRFARFIQLEVLPAVLSNGDLLAAYPNIAFTENPEGKATLGCSSGGAAALTMGWFRPEWFRRLITYSGTFVDQQDDDAAEEALFPLGAWEYHSSMELIKNTEPKPLRVFLHVSDGDLNFGPVHNWPEANQRTADALDEMGYHYRFIYANDAGHCDGKVFDQTLADTLVWTWRGYPTD